MRIDHDVKSVTDVRRKAADLLRRVHATRRPVVITQRGQPRGVLMDFGSFQELRKATLLLRLIAQSESDARRHGTVPQEQVFANLRAPLVKR